MHLPPHHVGRAAISSARRRDDPADGDPSGRPRQPGAAVDLRLVALIGVALLLHFTPERWKLGCEERFADLPPLLQGAAVAVVIGLLVLVSGQAQPYYYFQF